MPIAPQHRKAPLPPSYANPTPGRCRWCGHPSFGRTTWHPECVRAYKLIHWPAVTRKAVWERDQGVCGGCQKDIVAHVQALHPHMTRETAERYTGRNGGRYWQHDHIRPLVEANGDLSYWTLDNIQTLCTECHVAKSTADLRRRKQERAARERAAHEAEFREGGA